MRTTIDLPDALFRTLKARAALEGVSMKALLGRALEAALQAPASTVHVAPPRPPLPSIRVGNPLPEGLSNAQLFELLGEDLDRR